MKLQNTSLTVATQSRTLVLITSKSFSQIVLDCHLITSRRKSSWFGEDWVTGKLRLISSRSKLSKKLYRDLTSSVVISCWICGPIFRTWSLAMLGEWPIWYLKPSSIGFSDSESERVVFISMLHQWIGGRAVPIRAALFSRRCGILPFLIVKMHLDLIFLGSNLPFVFSDFTWHFLFVSFSGW